MRPQDVRIPAPEKGAQGGVFGMDAEALLRAAEPGAVDAPEEKQSPKAQVVHTKKVLELRIQAQVAALAAGHCP